MRWIAAVALAASACFSKPGFGERDGGTDDAMAAGQNVLFVTSETVDPGTFGADLAAADAICERLATAANLPANRYIAWLSSAAKDARTRVTDLNPTAMGWVRPDGKPIATTLTSLATGRHLHPPRLDERGNDVSQGEPEIATGTLGGGTGSNATCANYSDRSDNILFGMSDANNRSWTEWSQVGCGETTLHMYCLGVDHSTTVSSTFDPAHRIAFISDPNVTLAAGHAAITAKCQTIADAKWPGRQVIAAVPDVGGSISDLLSTTGAPWARPDGVIVMTDADRDELLAPLADKNSVTPLEPVVAGVEGFTVAGISGSTCMNWSSSTGMAVAGDAERSRLLRALSSGNSVPCSATNARVYCFER